MDIKKLGKFLDVLQSNDNVTVSLEQAGDLCNIRYTTREIYEIIRSFFDEAIARQWVSVSERLPDDGIPVLVTYVGCNDGKPHSDGVAIWSVKANAYVGRWLWELDRSEAADEITHWMTLPEPPKG